MGYLVLVQCKPGRLPGKSAGLEWGVEGVVVCLRQQSLFRTWKLPSLLELRVVYAWCVVRCSCLV